MRRPFLLLGFFLILGCSRYKYKTGTCLAVDDKVFATTYAAKIVGQETNQCTILYLQDWKQRDGKPPPLRAKGTYETYVGACDKLFVTAEGKRLEAEIECPK